MSSLTLILDLCPRTGAGVNMDHWLNSILSFANSHLLLSEKNALTVIACHFDKNQFIYLGSPSASQSQETGSAARDGQHDSLRSVTEAITKGVKDLISDTKQRLNGRPGKGCDEPLISGAISLALCSIHKRKQEFASSRIAVLTPSTDYPFFLTTQYMNFMNAFFTAQKMDVMIDVAVSKSDSSSGEDSSSSILRQGCDISGGSYLSIPKPEALLQYLMWVLLPDQETRNNLVLPQKTAVGSKAACFCHRTLLDVGYVCSVCLSVFCTFSPICSTCSTIFKLGPLPATPKNNRKGRK